MNVQNEITRWWGQVLACIPVKDDGTIGDHTRLFVRNRRGTHIIIVMDTLKISSGTHLEVEMLKDTHQIVKISRAERDPLGYFNFFNQKPNQQAVVVQLAHDTFHEFDHKHSEYGLCDYCHDSQHADHWWSMTTEARRVYLVSHPLRANQFMPEVISGGADFWEFHAEFLGKGLIHPNFRIAQTNGWQNRMWTAIQGPMYKIIAFVKKSELSLITGYSFVSVITWDKGHGGDEEQFKLTVYGGPRDEKNLLEYVAQFEKHSIRVRAVEEGEFEVVVL